MKKDKISKQLFDELKKHTDSTSLYKAASDKKVCSLVDDFIEELKEPARTQVKESISLGLVQGFISLDEWKQEVALKCPEDFKSSLLGEENGFTRTRMLVSCEVTSNLGTTKEEKFSMPAPYNPMMNTIETRKQAKAKFGNSTQVIGWKLVLPKDKTNELNI